MTSIRDRKKGARAMPPIIEYHPAKVTATLAQLREIGIDEDLEGREVSVYDIDRYEGMYAPCSMVKVDSMFDNLVKKGVNIDYIIPTRWIEFIKK